ncbi:MAG: type II secretion system F family protein, partial [bacterium]|nr:type II secretion system F family protein [bacterium]
FYSIQKSNLLGQFETSIIKIGENTENLTYALKKLEDLLVKRQNLMQNLIKSMIFPLIFISVLSFIMIIFKNLIIPAFNNLYVDLGIEAPFAFKILSFLTSIFDIKVILFLGFNMIIIFFIIYNLFKSNLKSFYRYVFMIPVLGKIFYSAYVALVLNLWAVALESGLPYSLTFKILEDETVEPFSSFFARMYDRAKRGELYEIVNFENTFKSMYVKQMNIALESGELPFTLKKLAEMAEIEANSALDTFNRILEPLMATLAGAITATLCLSIFSPIMYIIRSI